MYIQVNGIELFYEKTGQGSPVLLLHGNGENHTIFDVLTKQLSQNHTVYAIDSRDHGKSSRVKILDYESMTKDTVSLIQELKIERPILYGFSDGGIIGLLLAIKYPRILSKLIVSGVNLRPDGMKNKYVISMKINYFFTGNNKIKLMLTQPDIAESDLQKIVTPALLLAGSNDLIKNEHTAMIAKNIPDSTLKILEGESHASYVVHSKKLYDIIKPFLSGN